jgi:hypothetical protein
MLADAQQRLAAFVADTSLMNDLECAADVRVLLDALTQAEQERAASQKQFKRRCEATNRALAAERRVRELTTTLDWLAKQIDGCIEAADAIALATGLATARALRGDLRDARRVLGEQRHEQEQDVGGAGGAEYDCARLAG